MDVADFTEDSCLYRSIVGAQRPICSTCSAREGVEYCSLLDEKLSRLVQGGMRIVIEVIDI